MKVEYFPSDSSIGKVKAIVKIPSSKFYIPNVVSDSGIYRLEYPEDIYKYRGTVLGSMYGYNESRILTYVLDKSRIHVNVIKHKLSLMDRISKCMHNDYYRYCDLEVRIPKSIYCIQSINFTESDDEYVVVLSNVLCKVFNKDLWIPGNIINTTIWNEVTNLLSFLSVRRK